MEDRASLSLTSIVATNLPFSDRVLKIVQAVVSRNSREEPADSLLRFELKRQRELSPETARDVARATFAVFRWRGWIDAGSTIHDQVAEALSLQKRFNTTPESFTDDELMSTPMRGGVFGFISSDRTLETAAKSTFPFSMDKLRQFTSKTH